MRSLTQVAFKSLAEYREEWCVSLYMPVDPARLQNRKDTIRLRNLLSEVAKQLREKGMRQPDIEKMLAEAQSVGSESDFWRDRQRGLALFIAPSHFSHHKLDVRLEEYLIISDRFQLKPLMWADRESESFYVLALSQNKVSLLKALDDQLHPVDLGQTPTSLEEALQFEDGGKQLQHRVVPRARAGGGQAIYHGHGSMFPDEKDSILHFFKKLDAGVRHVLRNDLRPVVLVGVDYIRALYAQASEYPVLMPVGISGHADGLTGKSIYDRAYEIVKPYFMQADQRALSSYQQNQHSMKTSNVLSVILPASTHGQVETLFVREGASCWGAYDENALTVTMHSERNGDSEDLLDVACVNTVIHGGEVIFLPADLMPDEADIAASFYYELEIV